MTVTDELQTLAREFERRFGGRKPTHVLRAPGRINLIGEHTDYNGFPVLPMAIDRCIRMALAPRDDQAVVLKDTESEAYHERQFDLAATIPQYAQGDWGNYVKAAAQSMVQLAQEEGRSLTSLRGMSCLVQGDIPPSSGLSSSTALVVASGMAFSLVNHMSVGRRELADRMAVAERYVGTQGGGMDQAVCLLAHEGEAVKVDFFPLRVGRVPFPDDHVVVAADSTVRADKAGRHRLMYNRRVLECRIATHLLARQLGVPPPERMAGLMALTDVPPADMPPLLEGALEGRESLSLRRAAALFDMDPGRFTREFLRLADGRLLPVPSDGLRVLQRCRHVLGEAQRTERAAVCLRGGDMAGLGRLMDASHRSCAEDYEVSCFELDQLVAILREAGALGARLTGAGFGGFAIGVVPAQRAGAVRQALLDRFYAPRGRAGEERVYVFTPAPGAVEEALA